MYVDLETIKLLWPELILVLLASWIYIGGTVQQSRLWWTLFSLAGYVVAGYAVFSGEARLWYGAEAGNAYVGSGPLSVDYLGHIVRLFAVGVGFLFALVASAAARRELASELLATLMLLVAGLMLVARANDLVFLFVSLELVSIPTYVLLYIGRSDRATSEAAVKYFFLSILSSGMLLYGMTMLYGIAGTTTISGAGESIRAAMLSGDSLVSLAPIALILILAGLGFKITAVPFHFYAPDVYQGATNANAGLLAVAPKIAGVIALIRLVVVAMPSVSEYAWQLTIVLALLTMTLGNVCALWQQNIRRMMAYSSIAHAGYMLIGISVALAASGSYGGVSATLFYLIVYAFGSLGTFAALVSLSSEQREISSLEELAGLGKTRPLAAAAIAVCMFSLAGIPPLAGFWGKLTLFSSSIRLALDPANGSLAFWFILLAIGGAVNAAIAAAYYLRVVSTMYFQSSKVEIKACRRNTASLAMGFAALVVIAVGALPRSIISETERAEAVSAQPRLAIQPSASVEAVAALGDTKNARQLPTLQD
ncbi:MAG: NADH-quinone oxidoreductase subunit N [Planctomycetaceae bacterium]|nr:NADH-quinone oxidoreductase subunit N [Planctomycetales bacterium]MCB9875234.1 NADH-quinone oxidoreductase subunit N [Planctomycetaceae bacterium]MCB9938870.1 NADH-quinone oxidoreductase subunit N [Planctomycetaceae bacterium]